jgi:hypothetical protein
MRNAVALHGLRRNFALLSVVMVAPERNNGVYAHMVQGLGYRPHKATQRYGTALRDEQAAGSSRGYVPDCIVCACTWSTRVLLACLIIRARLNALSSALRPRLANVCRSE